MGIPGAWYAACGTSHALETHGIWPKYPNFSKLFPFGDVVVIPGHYITLLFFSGDIGTIYLFLAILGELVLLLL
jgi:hypothetical protein